MSRAPGRLRRASCLVCLLVAVGVVLMVGWALPAGAHSFLVSTSPFQDQRLDAAPEAVQLEFSEAVDLESVLVGLQTASGEIEQGLEPEIVQGGLGVRAAIRPLDDGVYVLAWQALSAVDGHGSSGEFAFSVGTTGETVPASNQYQPIDTSSMVASWLFTAGLALALGANLLAAVRACDADLVRRIARPGLLIALAGAGTAAWSDRSGIVVLVVVIELLLTALVLAGLGRSWRWQSPALVASAAAWATRSHGSGDGVVGWAIDFVHLAAGAAWLGSLLLVVAVAWRMRRRELDWLSVVRRYARPALWLVVVLGAAGTVGAVRLVPSWSQLWSTTYGTVVVAKVALLVLAVAAAILARWRGLHGARATLARRVMTGEAVAVIAAAGLAGLLSAGAPPLPASAAEQLLGAPPLGPDVSRDAGLAGQINVEVTSNGRRLDVSVFGPSGPLAGTQVEVALTEPGGATADLLPRPCGAGCFTQTLDLEPGSTSITVTAISSDLTGGDFEGVLEWPPGDREPDRLAELVQRMRQVPELTLIETVDSGPGSVVEPTTFTIGGDAFVDAQPYAAANLEQVRFQPGPPGRLTLYLPGSRIFVEMELDDSGRLASERLVTPGHLITRTFRYQD